MIRVERLIKRFGSTVAVDDIDESTARSIRETLIRVTESTIFDQYN